MSTSTPPADTTPRRRLTRAAVQLPPDTMAKVEQARSRAAVGSARPSVAAVLRAAVEAGLPALLGAESVGDEAA